MKTNRIFCWEKDEAIAELWKNYLGMDSRLIELRELEEMFFCTSSDEPFLLMLRENSLSQAEIHILSKILSSFRGLQVLVFGQFLHLKWCVEMMKLERTQIVPLPEGKEEFLNRIGEIMPAAEESPNAGNYHFNLLLREFLKKLLEKPQPLQEACKKFEEAYQDCVFHAAQGNLDKSAEFLRVERTDLIRNLVQTEGVGEVICHEHKKCA